MGYIYLIQPAELHETNKYKVGCSTLSNLSRLTCGYRKNFIPISIIFCEQPKIVEHKILQEFAKQFELVAGREIFEGDIEEMRNLFYSIAKEFPIISHGSVHTNTENKNNELDIVENIQSELNENEIHHEIQKSKAMYTCSICAYKSKIKTHYVKHLSTKKHKQNIENMVNNNEINNYIDVDNVHMTLNHTENDSSSIYRCKFCYAQFRSKSSKYRHQSKYCKKMIN